MIDFHEEMGIMIQEVVGRKVGDYYFPALAGVAFSNNEYRWSRRLRREDGLLRLVTGLGTRAVDRMSDDYPFLLSPGQPNLRANVTIGRAVRLVLMNVGGGLPGTGDRATQGNPAKIAYCVAEHEGESPWEPLHVEAGLPADVSTVTAFGCEGPDNIQDHYSHTGLGVLLTVAGAMGQAGSNNLLGAGS